VSIFEPSNARSNARRKVWQNELEGVH